MVLVAGPNLAAQSSPSPTALHLSPRPIDKSVLKPKSKGKFLPGLDNTIIAFLSCYDRIM